MGIDWKTRGKRTDVIQVFDDQTLKVIDEIPISTQRAQALSYRSLLQRSSDGNLLFAFHNYCLGNMPGFPPIDPGHDCGIEEKITQQNAEAHSGERRRNFENAQPGADLFPGGECPEAFQQEVMVDFVECGFQVGVGGVFTEDLPRVRGNLMPLQNASHMPAP